MADNTFRCARNRATTVSSEEAISMIDDPGTVDKLKVAWIKRFGMLYAEDFILSSYIKSGDIVRHAWIDYCVKTGLFLKSSTLLDDMLRKGSNNNISYVLDAHKRCPDAFPDMHEYIKFLLGSEPCSLVTVDRARMHDIERLKDHIIRDLGLPSRSSLTGRLLMRRDIPINADDVMYIINNYRNNVICTLLYRRNIDYSPEVIEILTEKSDADRQLSSTFYRWVVSDDLTDILIRGMRQGDYKYGVDVMRAIMLRRDVDRLSSEIMQEGCAVPNAPEKLRKEWMSWIRRTTFTVLGDIDEEVPSI